MLAAALDVAKDTAGKGQSILFQADLQPTKEEMPIQRKNAVAAGYDYIPVREFYDIDGSVDFPDFLSNEGREETAPTRMLSSIGWADEACRHLMVEFAAHGMLRVECIQFASTI